MSRPIILASGSDTRQKLLRDARVPFEFIAPRIDETLLKTALLDAGASPRDVADSLAEQKAVKISRKHPDAVVIGCDQVLEYRGMILSKPNNPVSARAQLARMRSERHTLLSAAVICHQGGPIWRHVGKVRLQMRNFSDAYLDAYLARNWNSIRHTVGAYKLEEEGIRLFSHIEGDYFNVLGLPLLEILAYLCSSGDLET